MALSDDGIEARTFAIMAAAADGRPVDSDALLEDLDAEDLGSLVHGLATMALMSMVPRGLSVRAPGVKARLADHLRSLVLERQFRD